MEADVYAVLVLSYRSFASKKVTWLLSTFRKLLPTMEPCQTQTYFSDKRGLSGIGGAWTVAFRRTWIAMDAVVAAGQMRWT
jgi:hypothetical protein